MRLEWAVFVDRWVSRNFDPRIQQFVLIDQVMLLWKACPLDTRAA
jgi:hypothetical protein